MNWAWAAGIIDGEGTIRVARKSSVLNYVLVLSCGMTCKRTIEILHRIFGCGSIRLDPPRNPKHSISYTLMVQKLALY